MPTYRDPRADATELQEAVRGLAHATRKIEDPTSVYSVLGSLTTALASLTQCLHQLGDFHDQSGTGASGITAAPVDGRAASYRISWELHRAAEMTRRVGETVDHAHELEGTITYELARLPPALSPSSLRPGMSL